MKLYHNRVKFSPRVGVCTGQSISSRLSSNPSFFWPLRLFINIVGLRPKASPGWGEVTCAHGCYARPSCWCVSCQPHGDGCIVETYLEFELCPSH